MSTKPYRTSRLAQFVTKRVLELKSRKTQALIAAEAGFPNPNMISMIKGGASKLALDRVPSLATALECDPARLFLMALEQIENPTTAKPYGASFGRPSPRTRATGCARYGKPVRTLIRPSQAEQGPQSGGFSANEVIAT